MSAPTVLATVTLFVLTAANAPGPTGQAAGTPSRQEVYSVAAQRHGVPEAILLGVSYLESRWDSNGGLPSTAGGYGPMHLTGEAGRATRHDPAANIDAGAALLRRYHDKTGDWHGAVARYSESDRPAAAAAFADEAFAVIRAGATRTTDDGHRVALPAMPGLRTPERTRARATPAECPEDISCEWMPAPYQLLGDGTDPGHYGNHDKAERSGRQQIEYIVIHNTEGNWDTTIRLAQDPTYISWHYTLRSADGHIAQHVKSTDIAWQAGNWYVNTKGIGLEHEGFARQGTWFTEAMYRTSAKLVRYLALRLGIPLDRQHIIGHDNVPAPTTAYLRGMHWDTGPYWDWGHYFELLRAPLAQRGAYAANAREGEPGLVVIDPDYATNRPAFTGCDPKVPAQPCPSRGSTSVILRTEPRPDAPLLNDIGLRPDGSPATMSVSDHGSRVDAGQIFAAAGQQGDWTAIWYLGQVGWFHNPPTAPTARRTHGLVVTPKAGRASVPVYGRAYPEASAYPAGVTAEPIAALPYLVPAGQRYAVGMPLPSEHYLATTHDGSRPGDWTVISGTTTYVQIQFGHRVMYVDRADVEVLPDITSGA